MPIYHIPLSINNKDFPCWDIDEDILSSFEAIINYENRINEIRLKSNSLRILTAASDNEEIYRCYTIMALIETAVGHKVSACNLKFGEMSLNRDRKAEYVRFAAQIGARFCLDLYACETRNAERSFRSWSARSSDPKSGAGERRASRRKTGLADRPDPFSFCVPTGAGEAIRTPDPHLGKVMLYP